MSFQYLNKINYEVGGEKVSSLDYFIEENVMHVVGVYTDSQFQGKGYARDIVNEMIRYAKENELLVMPVCPYVISIFDREDYSDLDARINH